MYMFEKHSRCIRYITLLIPLLLACVGMRVPDFSRSHNPKPMRRAVLDKSSARTIAQSVVKVAVEPVILSQHTFVFLPTEVYSPESHSIYLPVPLLSLSPFPPRAPPTTYPLA